MNNIYDFSADAINRQRHLVRNRGMGRLYRESDINEGGYVKYLFV